MKQGMSILSYFFYRLLPWVVGFLLGSMIFPSPALAFIPHWDPKEAFFIRQFSYLFFMVAMIFFIYELKLERLPQHRGFRLLTWASVFFALWNLIVSSGNGSPCILKPRLPRGHKASFHNA